MGSRTVERELPACAPAVYAWLIDPASYGRIPGVRARGQRRTGHPDPLGAGAVHEFAIDQGPFLLEVIEAVPGRSIRFQVVHPGPSFDHLGGAITLRPLDGATTRVTWRTTYEYALASFASPADLVLASFATPGPIIGYAAVVRAALTAAARELREAA